MPSAPPNSPLIQWREAYWCYFSVLGFSLIIPLKIFLPTPLAAHVPMNENENPARSCNCRRGTICPLNGECLKSCIVYQATLKSEKSASTKLSKSKRVWQQKEKGKNYEIE